MVDAQPPGDTKRDGHSPLPPAQENQAVEALKYQIPDKDRMIFQGFLNSEDRPASRRYSGLEPIAKETENSDEYRAWHEVVQHAAQFPAADLDRSTATREPDLGRPDRLAATGHTGFTFSASMAS